MRALETWLKGTAAAAIGGGSNAIAAALVDPQHFNPFQAGFGACWKIVITGAAIAVAHYLAKSPLPGRLRRRNLATKKGRRLDERKTMSERVTQVCEASLVQVPEVSRSKN